MSAPVHHSTTKYVDVTCGRPGVKSHKAIRVERFERSAVGGEWHWAQELAPRLGDALLAGTDPPIADLDRYAEQPRPHGARAKLRCPMCGLEATRDWKPFTDLLDKSFANGESEITLTRLVAIFTRSLG
ncbi:MAG TPA: hypothetical protein VGL75_10415 [Acidothermaceae bacterium]